MPGPLLEPVAAGQTRFRMQGLAPDGRGIAVGREALLTFESIDRLVAFLGAYSAEASLDELLPSTTIDRARREGGGLNILLRCAASDAYQLDRLGRLARATRSQVFVGSGRTFIRARERKAPFGYDLAVPLSDLGARKGETVLAIDLHHATRYEPEGIMDPVDLVQRLALRPVPIPSGGLAADPEMAGMRQMALVLVAPGLADRVLSYLWRREVEMAGVRLAFGDDAEASLLLRLRNPDPVVLDVLRQIPGVELLAPVSARAAVEVGWQHPIHLAAADSCLPGDEMCLFRGGARRVERLEGAPRFVDGKYLVRSELQGQLRDIEGVAGFEPKALQVDLRVRPSSQTREIKAVLVPWEQLESLRRMIYAIPPSALANASLAPLLPGLLVVSSRPGARTRHTGVDLGAVLPLGKRYVEAGPGVLVPEGHELWPRVRPKLARELMGLSNDDVAIFLDEDSVPARIDAEQLQALDAASVARFVPESVAVSPDSLPALEAAQVVNETLPRFALWGFRRRAED
jgi:hypothetical protein